MDTTRLANIAEDLIAHKLQDYGLLVAKPKFDTEGTDLLAFAEMADGVKFCRVQCKGRSLESSPTSNIKIPKSYVSNGFIVVLYLTPPNDDGSLYVFFPSDIRNWPQDAHRHYRLSISRTTYIQQLDRHKFDESKVSLIRTLIAVAQLTGEFHNLIHGAGRLRASSAAVDGRGFVHSKSDQ